MTTWVAAQRARRRRSPLLLTAAAVPWLWFAVRDLGAAFDVVATGLPVIVVSVAVAGLLLARVTHRATPAVLSISLLAMGSVAVLGPWLPRSGPPPLHPMRVVSTNVLDGNPSPAKALDDIRAQDGDVVAVVEGGSKIVEQGLRRLYPFAGRDRTTEHILVARYPVRKLPVPVRLLSVVQVTRWEVRPPSGSVVVYTVHLNHPAVREVRSIRPKLRRQRDQVRALLDAEAAELEPTMLIGDFNISDRTWGYRQLASRLPDAMRRITGGPTYVRIRYRPFLLRIDNIFVPKGWCSDDSVRFHIRGSDHRGVAATVGPCP